MQKKTIQYKWNCNHEHNHISITRQLTIGMPNCNKNKNKPIKYFPTRCKTVRYKTQQDKISSRHFQTRRVQYFRIQNNTMIQSNTNHCKHTTHPVRTVHTPRNIHTHTQHTHTHHTHPTYNTHNTYHTYQYHTYETCQYIPTVRSTTIRTTPYTMQTCKVTNTYTYTKYWKIQRLSPYPTFGDVVLDKSEFMITKMWKLTSFNPIAFMGLVLFTYIWLILLW